MNDPQSNRLDMYLVVQGFYTDNQAAIDAVPARAAAFGQLAGKITAINAQVAGQSAITTGVSQDKAALRATLDVITANILLPSRTWALAAGNNTLAAEFDFPLSSIQRIKDDTMQGFCDHRIPLVNDNLIPLADYGIDAASITQWQTALDAYVAVLETPREAINSKHLHTENLKTLFSETGTLFRETIDPLMSVLKTTDPSLYDAYKQARIIIDRRGSGSQANVAPDTIQFGLYAYDRLTELPIQNAFLRVLNAPDGQIHQAATNAEGILTLSVSGYVPEVPTMVQTEITADGYITVPGESEFTPGQSYSFDVPLDPEPTP